MLDEIVTYIDVSENRQKLILIIGQFIVVGGLLVSAVMFWAAYNR